MKTILIILSLILVVFFLSEDKKLNTIMKKQSIPFIIILSLFYFFFNKIDIKIIAFSLIITLICCSNLFSKGNIIIERLKLIGGNIEEEEQDDIDQNDIDQNDFEEQDNFEEKNNKETKETFNYEELHGMFKGLDEQINNK